MIGANVIDHPALDHRQRFAVQLDVFADQRAGGLIKVGEAVGSEHMRRVSPTIASLSTGCIVHVKLYCEPNR